MDLYIHSCSITDYRLDMICPSSQIIGAKKFIFPLKKSISDRWILANIETGINAV